MVVVFRKIRAAKRIDTELGYSRILYKGQRTIGAISADISAPLNMNAAEFNPDLIIDNDVHATFGVKPNLYHRFNRDIYDVSNKFRSISSPHGSPIDEEQQ